MTHDFRDTYPLLPAGCDQQGRYITRPYKPITDDELLRRATDAIVAKYSTGQPIAGESVPDDETPLVVRTDAPGFWVPVAFVLGLIAFGVWYIS